MIGGFAGSKDGKQTEAFWREGRSRRIPPDIRERAMAKLQYLHAAKKIDDLRLPPANRLEPLKGDRKGQYSIRINDQYRICFRWDGIDAHDVEITDYH